MSDSDSDDPFPSRASDTLTLLQGRDFPDVSSPPPPPPGLPSHGRVVLPPPPRPGYEPPDSPKPTRDYPCNPSPDQYEPRLRITKIVSRQRRSFPFPVAGSHYGVYADPPLSIVGCQFPLSVMQGQPIWREDSCRVLMYDMANYTQRTGHEVLLRTRRLYSNKSVRSICFVPRWVSGFPMIATTSLSKMDIRGKREASEITLWACEDQEVLSGSIGGSQPPSPDQKQALVDVAPVAVMKAGNSECDSCLEILNSRGDMAEGPVFVSGSQNEICVWSDLQRIGCPDFLPSLATLDLSCRSFDPCRIGTAGADHVREIAVAGWMGGLCSVDLERLDVKQQFMEPFETFSRGSHGCNVPHAFSSVSWKNQETLISTRVKTLNIWSTRTAEPVATYNHPSGRYKRSLEGLSSVCAFPESHVLLVGGHQGLLLVLDSRKLSTPIEFKRLSDCESTYRIDRRRKPSGGFVVWASGSIYYTNGGLEGLSGGGVLNGRRTLKAFGLTRERSYRCVCVAERGENS